MLIKAQNLTLERRVHNLNFTLDNGECLALLGRTGSGKSSTLELLSSLEEPTSGSLLTERKVGYLFQDSNLQLFENSVYKEVSFTLRKAKVDKKRIDESVRKALALVNLDFERYHDALPYCLSGGEQKKVALASLLVQECDLFLFDEPTVGLDKSAKDELLLVLKRLKANGKGIVIVSHDLPFVYSLADKIIHLDKGKVTFEGSVKEFATKMSSLTPLTRISKALLGTVHTSFDEFIKEVVNGQS